MVDFYSLQIRDTSGKIIAMNEHKGKVVLIVNTATECGLASQFDGLEVLHQRYKDKGLVVIGTPCNQFSGQEPVQNGEMVEVCRLQHGVTFMLTEKIKVNGQHTHSLYVYLKEKLGSLLGRSIKWNFTKFLIDAQGKPYKRYAPTTTPEKLEGDIQHLLGMV